MAPTPARTVGGRVRALALRRIGEDGIWIALTSVIFLSAMTLPVSGVMILLGAGVGLMNGLLVVRLKIHPLILTFGMMSILQGVIADHPGVELLSAESGDWHRAKAKQIA